jgi:hypothetical protein
MSKNRNTVKNDIVAMCIPSVSNAEMITILNSELADNLKFREDKALPQTSVPNAVLLDFTGKDRIDLIATGGPVIISISSGTIADGETVHLLLIKTGGQSISWVSVTDITPVKANVTAVGMVLYEIVRKGSYYYSRAWIESPLNAMDSIPGVISPATVAEHKSLTIMNKACVPGRLPMSSVIQTGIVKIAATGQINNGDDTDPGSNQLVVQPSELLRKIREQIAWVDLGITAFFTSVIKLQYYMDSCKNVHIRCIEAIPSFNDNGDTPANYNLSSSALPVGFRPTNYCVPFIAMVSLGTIGSQNVKLSIHGFIDISGNIILTNSVYGYLYPAGFVHGFTTSGHISFYVVFKSGS